MGIAFMEHQWQQVSESYESWWEGRLERPLIPVWLAGRDPGRPRPAAPSLDQSVAADLSIPVDALIDRMDWDFSCYDFLGDAYPYLNFAFFGPGVVAAFLGAELDASTGQIWFHPAQLREPSNLELVYDPENVWLRRVRELYKAAVRRWGDQVLLSIPDLGGTLDILTSFRPGERFLFDLVDEPDEVVRLNWQIHHLWHRYFDEFSELLQGGIDPAVRMRGWTDWSGTFSAKPAYILQSDATYMISPTSFDTIVAPELAASARRLGRAIYHLDGVGQLAHLDTILRIPEIRAIQWVPGDGKPTQEQWPDVMSRIHDGGKNMLLHCGLEQVDTIVRLIGGTRGICVQPMHFEADQRDEAQAWLRRYGV